MSKRVAATACVLVLILSLILAVSCSRNKGSVDFGDYQPETEIVSQSEAAYDVSQVLDIDTSWQTAYALSYTFYDKDSGYSEITEGKCGNYYQSLDSASNILTFISQEDGYMMEYVLNDTTKTGTAAVVTDSDINNLNSGFSLMSACDPYLPVYSNVTRVGDDFVAKRSAVRYKQVQQDDDGNDEKIAYIWIDDQYSFASRCELYDAKTEELLLKWELTGFTTDVSESGVKIDVNQYTLTTG